MTNEGPFFFSIEPLMTLNLLEYYGDAIENNKCEDGHSVA